MKAEVDAMRQSMLYHFTKTGKQLKHGTINKCNDTVRRVTRSATAKDDGDE